MYNTIISLSSSSSSVTRCVPDVIKNHMHCVPLVLPPVFPPGSPPVLDQGCRCCRSCRSRSRRRIRSRIRSCSCSCSCSSVRLDPVFPTDQDYYNIPIPVWWLHTRFPELKDLLYSISYWDPESEQDADVIDNCLYTLKEEGNVWFVLIPDPATIYGTVRYIPVEIPVNSPDFRKIRGENTDLVRTCTHIPDATLPEIIWALYHPWVSSVKLRDIYADSFQVIKSWDRMKMLEFDYNGFRTQVMLSRGKSPDITQSLQRILNQRVVILPPEPRVWGWQETKYKLVPSNYILEEGERELVETDYSTELLRINLEDGKYFDVFTETNFLSYNVYMCAETRTVHLPNHIIYIIKGVLYDRIYCEHCPPDENDYGELEAHQQDRINDNLHPLSAETVRNIYNMEWNGTRHELYLSGALEHNSLLCSLVLGCGKFVDIKDQVVDEIENMLRGMSFTYSDYILKN